MESVRTEVTRLLGEVHRGNQAAVNELFPLVYEEMRRIAQGQRIGWHGDLTLNTTALVHEAYLKLVDQTNPDWQSRAHFLAVAAKAMRHILINYAQQRRAQKRGGNVVKLSLEEMVHGGWEVADMDEERAEVLVILDEQLNRLENLSERQSRVVECRFFGGMSIEETAAALGISPATVKRDWVLAQAWLQREIKNQIKE